MENLWKDSSLARSVIDNYYLESEKNDYVLELPKEFSWLRAKQKESFSLFSYNKGILSGPPGTGKTTTLGTLIASYIKDNQDKKILLMSLINLAVNQILESVDKQLNGFINGNILQKKCVRLGSNINSEYYKNKDYLVAAKDNSLLEELVALEKDKPEKRDAVEYNEWLLKYEELKKNKN